MSSAGEVLRRSFPDSQLHVLAVDDSVTDRKVIERLLKVSSFKVTAVDSGTRALQFLGLDGQKDSAGFDGLKVNLIMTDYSMPGMTGYDLLKRVKESSALREIPVVIMSSEKIITRIDRCLQEGAEEFIVKPVKLSDVKRLKDFVMRVEVEESNESGKWKRSEEEENRDKTTVHKRKPQAESLISRSPQSPLLSRGSDSVSSQQPPSIPFPQCSCKQPRLCITD